MRWLVLALLAGCTARGGIRRIDGGAPRSNRVIAFVHSLTEPREDSIIFGLAGTPMVTVSVDTGAVKIADGVTLDQATRTFWRVVEEQFEATELHRLRDENARLRARCGGTP